MFQGASNEAAYAAEHPIYAEYCALSQIKKRVGFGADIRGEIGGHAVFYLNGACLVRDAHYPVLAVCDEDARPSDGVGLSMNAHFSNAKWVATPGRAFFFDGDLPGGAPVTQDSYRTVQARARALGIYEGVVFHREVFRAKPAAWTDDAWRYEMSVATDYAIGLGRGRYCARVPVTRAQLGRMVDFLNAENAPYRDRKRVFRWSVFNDNCIHLAHNALAAAGLWPSLRIERPLPLALFDFPVPKNEFVNLMRRTNDDWFPDPGAAYRDVSARTELLRDGTLPSGPGSLAEAHGPHEPNEVYETSLKLVFYDDPVLGSYAKDFDRIYAESRTTDMQANRAYFGRLARAARADRKPLGWWLARSPFDRDPDGFSSVYTRYYSLMDRLAG